MRIAYLHYVFEDFPLYDDAFNGSLWCGNTSLFAVYVRCCRRYRMPSPTHSRLIISLKSGALASERRKGVDPRVNVGVVLWKVESIFAIMSAESGKSKCAIWFFQITHPSASHICTDDMFLLFKIITALRAQVYDYIHYTLSKMHFLWK